MAILNRASVGFTILDNFDKTYLNNAIITCSAPYNTCIKKGSGTYAFINMSDGDYKFEVSCFGYISMKFDVNVRAGRPVMIVACMNLSRVNNKLFSNDSINFRLKDGNNTINNENIEICLESKVPFLRVAEDTSKNADRLKLNIDYNPLLVYQDLKAGEDFIIRLSTYNDDGYKVEPGCPALEQGDLLKPVWNIRTDENGGMVLPINKFYMPKEDIDFIIKYRDKSQRVKANIRSNNDIEINF